MERLADRRWRYAPDIRRRANGQGWLITFQPCARRDIEQGLSRPPHRRRTARLRHHDRHAPTRSHDDKIAAERFYGSVWDFLLRWGDVEFLPNGAWAVEVESASQSRSLLHQLAELVDQVNDF